MRKWCPEPLDTPREEFRTPAGPPNRPFATDSTISRFPGAGQEGGAGPFEKDLDLTCRPSPWELLNQAEKDRLRDEVKAELRGEFELREKELRQRQREERAALQAEWSQRMENWSREMRTQLAEENHARAVEATGLALALARKIIRDHVEVDRGLLVRTVETALLKIGEARPLTLILHPEEEQFLKNHPEMMDRLGIGQVIPDRRVDKGGCRIRAGVREWDATLEGQMKAVAETLAETLAVAEAGVPGPEGAGDPVVG
jgi:flagellar assembly protein FliH